MRRLFLIVILLFAASARGMAQGDASHPESAELASCGQAEAHWIYRWQKDERSDADSVPVTKSWSCTVNKNTLFVRFREENVRTYQCSAVGHVYVSVWVNGVKLLTQEDAGEFVECAGGGQLDSVSLNGTGNLKICRIDYHEPYAGNPKSQCERITPAVWRGKPADPNYALRDIHTPPGLELRVGNPSTCTALTSRLQPVPWPSDRDSSFSAEEIVQPPWQHVKNSNPDLNSFMYLWAEDYDTANFDADNDGIADEVMRSTVTKVHGMACCQLAWRRAGSTAQPYLVPDLPHDVKSADKPAEESSWLVYDIRPIRLAGRTVLYLRRAQAFEWDDDSETRMGASPYAAEVITRGLMELHPDGTSALLCGWGPRPRPEEFL